MTLKGRPYCFHNGFPAVSGRPGDGHWEPVVGHCTNGLVHTQWKSGMSEVGYGSTVTWPVSSRARLTLGIPESKVGMLVRPEHSHWLAQTEREMTQVRLSVFDHADVEKYSSTNRDECSVGDRLRDPCFMCGLSLVEMPLHDTWLCVVVEIAVELRWLWVIDIILFIIITSHLLSAKPKLHPLKAQ